MTEAEAAKIVAVIAAMWPDKFTADTGRMYERMIRDLDYDATNAAVERLIVTETFLPSVAKIRDAAVTVVHGEVRAGGDAWGDFLRAVGKYGAYRTPGKDFQFRDPVLTDVVDSLGWKELCLSEESVADRARFVQLYDRKAAEHRRSQVSESLPAARRLAVAQGEQTKRLGPGTRSGK